MPENDPLEAIPDPRRRASIKLTIIARQMRKRFDELAGEVGVTRPQWGAIGVVKLHPGITQRAIAEKLEISDVSAGRLVDRLVADGLLEKRPHQDDGRAFAIFVTATGDALVARLEAFASDAEEIAWAGFDEAMVQRMNADLDRLYLNLLHPKLQS